MYYETAGVFMRLGPDNVGLCYDHTHRVESVSDYETAGKVYETGFRYATPARDNIVLGWFWDPFGMVWGSFWDRFWLILEGFL